MRLIPHKGNEGALRIDAFDELRARRRLIVTRAGSPCHDEASSHSEFFKGLIRKDNEKALNLEAITLARKENWTTDWEQKFCIDTFRKRIHSHAEAEQRCRSAGTV